MSRDYKKERDNYHSRPEQMARNAARKRARRQMEREGKAKAGDGKDVHHKDNNPLNNDKKNLSLVTKHYNRKEPRLREDEDFQEGPLVSNEVAVAKMLSDKFYAMLMKGNFEKKRQLASKIGIKISQHHKRVKIEGLEEAVSHNRLNKIQRDAAQAIQVSGRNDTAGLETKAMYKSSDEMKKSTRAFQLHFDKQKESVRKLIAQAVNRVMNKSEVYYLWDAKFAKIITSFGEDMGSVTGPHIAGTGDDSSTVVVKKKKKKKVNRRESLKKRIIDNVLAIQQKV